MSAPEPLASLLLVDDHPADLLTLDAVLGTLGHRLVQAGSGDEALRCVAREEFAVILIDAKMPGLDGFETVERIRENEHGRSTPIIFLSAHEKDQLRISRAYDLGAIDYLSKPFDHGVLRAKVRAFVELYLARRRAGERAAGLAAELAKSEARFRTFVDSIPLLAWSARPDGAVDYYNTRWYAYTGRVPDDAQNDTPAIPPERAAEAGAAWRRSVESGDDFELEVPIRRGDGAFRWHLVRAVPIRDEGGRIVRWFGTSTDIDDHKRAETEREGLFAREREARNLAEEASRAKDNFLATISHELRTPLNAILGWARLLRGGASGPAQLERAFEVIERNALAQAKLVDDLLDVSRLSSGKVRLKRERVALAAAAREALDALASAALAKRLSLKVETDDEGEVIGDAERLQQIAWNLVSNAVKFSPAGASVRVALRREGGEVVLSVTDEGPGIPLGFLPHVFDPFRQADGSITRLHGGLGVGLSIARQFVELHGGTIAAASGGEGAGTTFTVRLPAAPPGEARPGPASAPNEGRVSLRGVRALVVDDEPDACELARAILEDAGAEVVTAFDAESALRTLIAWAPDVLVSDVGMPVTDGYALVRRVRRLSDRHASRTPAVALTAFVRAEDRLRALEAGFNAYVPKPVDPAELTLVVAGAARSPR